MLAAEKANPRRVLRTLEWNAEDVAEVQNSLLGEGEHYDFMEMPRDQRGYMWCDRVEIDRQLVGTATPPAGTATSSARCSRWPRSTWTTPRSGPRWMCSGVLPGTGRS